MRSEREPGRSFQDSTRPLGQSLIDEASRTTPPTEENFKSRERQARLQANADPRGVAQRAKVVGVLRKAEEFMRTSNPPPQTRRDVRRALELASGRVGLTYAEYRAIADRDPELLELERRVIEDARIRAGVPLPETIAANEAASAPSEPEEKIVHPPLSAFARIFVPVDFSMASHRAVQMALEFRKMHGSDVCIFHAMESSGSDDFIGGIGSPSVQGDWVSEGEGRVRRFLDNIAPDAGPGIEIRADIGFTVRTLCRQAKRWGATLLIVRADPRVRVFGSFTDQLVRKVGLPVLVLP